MGSINGEGKEDQQQPSIPTDFSDNDFDEQPIKRTGTIWTAISFIITTIIGAGVLSLAWCVAQLGWVAGPLTILIFAAISLTSATLLSDCYRSPEPEFGPIRNRTYTAAVKYYLVAAQMSALARTISLTELGFKGENHKLASGIFFNASLYGIATAYVITIADSVGAIQKSNCYHKEGHDAQCNSGENISVLIFGGVQIIVSQIPNLHNMAWLSIIATIMSFSYAFTGFGLGFAKVIENGEIKGSITGITTHSRTDKAWLVFQAIGNIAFTYPFSIVLLEIQDTLKSPPAENKTMKKACTAAVLIITFFFLCCGCFGYAAFGNATPGNLLIGFGFYEPYWLIDFANACIILHLVGGYQVLSQPVFAVVEGWLSGKFPNRGFVKKFYLVNLVLLPTFQLNPLRLCFRTAYVISTTVIAMTFPYFNEILGALGAFNFWPMTIYFPVRMYIVQKKIEAWTTKWIALQTFSIASLIVSILTLMSSLQGVIKAKLS